MIKIMLVVCIALPDSRGSSASSHWGDLVLPKGRRRAWNFYGILREESNPMPFRIFTLQTLLREKDGTNLKKRIRLNLIYQFGQRFLAHMETYLARHYTKEKISVMENKLLEIIHKDYIEMWDTSEEDFRKAENYMESVVNNVLAVEEKPVNTRCIVM